MTVAGREQAIRDRFAGCLLGGAVGDALGAPVEFDSLGAIRRRFGSAGVTGYVRAYGRLGAVTDDTQMTLFTAEGLIRAEHRHRDRGLVNLDSALARAYQRWLSTQVDPDQVPWDPDFGPGNRSGWLVANEFLRHRRAPGNTCVSALLAGPPPPGRRRSSPGPAIRADNASKGCGGVMRVAPVGLVAGDPFDVGCRAAALTHGHPSGWLAAGAFADMIGSLRHGGALPAAVAQARAATAAHPDSSEVVGALDSAVDLAAGPGPLTADAVESLGGGWVAEEALAIAVCCALRADSFTGGVLTAVNHGGDSDSTASMTGSLLGTTLGSPAIDAALVADLEGSEVITQVAVDLYDGFVTGNPIDWQRYPTW